MEEHQFSIIYWNIWLELQNGKRDISQLIVVFNKLIDKYEPDFFGLNEVVMNTNTNHSAVLETLKLAGYHAHFVPFSNIADNLVVGSALASKIKPNKIKNVPLGPDTQAMRRGFPDQKVSLIHGEFCLYKKPITITVNYLGNLIPLDWGTHVTHRKSFNEYLHNLKPGNIVIGGDFNEPKYLWPWLKLPKHYKRLTGGLMSPTWRLLGKKALLLSANYDYILYDTSSDLHLEKFQILGRKPSDHSPLYARFTLD